MILPPLTPEINQRYRQINDTTLFHADDVWSTEIGDSKQPDFYPQVKISGADNNCNFSIRLSRASYQDYSVKYSGDKIHYSSPDADLYIYWMPPDNDNEAGRMELEGRLSSKPASNIINFTLQHKNIEAHYQPPLTPEQITAGDERSPDINGSYAIYSRDGMPRAGKLGHISRPILIDDIGQTAWADLSIDLQSNTMQIIMPQSFLDSAVYPVIVDPDFGYTTTGSTNAIVSSTSNAYALRDTTERYTATSGDTVTTLTIHIKQVSGAGDLGVTVYDFTTAPVNRAGTPVNITATDPTTGSWRSGAVSYSLTGGTNYCVAMGDVGSDVRVSYDSGSADSSTQTSNTLGATWSELTTSVHLWSMYATYTAGGGGSATPPIGSFGLLGIGL